MSPPIGRAGSQEGGAGPPGKTILHELLYLISYENYCDIINI
jgi:hypothetical protein